MSAAVEGDKVADLAPKLKARAEADARALARQPWKSKLQPGMNTEDECLLAIEWVNEQYALVDQGGALSVWSRKPNPITGAFSIYSRKDFETLMEPYQYPSGAEKPPRLAKIWFMHERRAMGVVGAWPIGQEPPNGINLWRGFGIEPRPGSWDTIGEYLLNTLCGGDTAAYDYLLDLVAWKLQNPFLPTEVALVLLSEESGTGKSSFAKMMTRIFGKGARTVPDAQLLFGRFGETLIGTSLVVLEEALFAPAKQMTDKFKSLVTEPTWTVDVKNKAPVSVPNQCWFIVNTNHARAVAAMPDDRRHFVLKVAPDRAGDAEYWQRLTHAAGTDPSQADLPGFGDELAAFLDVMLRTELGRWHPRLDIPQGGALHEQKLLSLEGVALFVHEMIEDGDASRLQAVREDGSVCGTRWPAGGLIVPATAHEAYLRWARERGERHSMSRRQFDMGMHKWLGVESVDLDTRHGKGAMLGCRRAWRLAHLDEVAERFQALLMPNKGRRTGKKS